MAGNVITEQAESRKLDEHLSFAIYSANLAFGGAYKQALANLGLTYTQYITLVALLDGKYQTVRSLGQKLYLESNTLTPVLQKLEKMGHVVRARNPDDERQVRVRLTPSGHRLVRRSLLQSGPVDLSCLTLEEIVTLYDGIVRMREELVAQNDAEDA